MKIAIIVPRLNVKGGTQRQAVMLAQELQKKGHDITLYTFRFVKEDCYNNVLNNLRVVSLDAYDPQWNRSRIRSFTRRHFFIDFVNKNAACRMLAQHIDKDTDILNPHAQLGYRVAYYFKKNIRDIPSVWMMNDMVSKTWGFWRDSRVHPSVRAPWLKRFVYWCVDWYDKRYILKQNAIVVLDHSNKKWVKEYYGQDARVVRSGLDTEQFRYSKRHPPRHKTVSILMTGILFYHRRYEDAIHALSLLRRRGYDATMSIIGDYSTYDGRYHAELVALIERLHVQKYIHFLGRVSDEELERAYHTHDVFLFSNFLQTWGLAPFEAMATGLPVIVSRGAGAHEVLTDAENALLVDAQSPDQIASAIEKLIHTPDLYEQLSKNGREFVEQNITWRKYADSMLAIFESIQ